MIRKRPVSLRERIIEKVSKRGRGNKRKRKDKEEKTE